MSTPNNKIKKIINYDIFKKLVKFNADFELSKKYFVFEELEILKNLCELQDKHGASWNWVCSNEKLLEKKSELWKKYFDKVYSLTIF
jgi:hypothetical protein